MDTIDLDKFKRDQFSAQMQTIITLYSKRYRLTVSWETGKLAGNYYFDHVGYSDMATIMKRVEDYAVQHSVSVYFVISDGSPVYR